MASVQKDDHGSANRLKFSELAPRVFEGPQGTDLQDFVELHNLSLGAATWAWLIRHHAAVL